MSDPTTKTPDPETPLLATAALATAALATIVVTPRERFGVAEESLRSIIDLTETPYELIYLDAGSPAQIAGRIKAVCEQHGFRYHRQDEFLTPNQARNLGQRLVTTPYVVFVDNDVVVSKGWLRALIDCAEETGAEVVAPLTCQRLPVHSEIHQAGGEFARDLPTFLNAAPGKWRMTDIHLLQGQNVEDVQLRRGETQCCEFHCALIRKATFERLGDLDENLLATKEHIDFCMTVWRSGGRVMFEPSSVVTYLFPSRARPLTKADWPYFALRWSPVWQRKSLEHFQRKWSMYDDPYFETRKGMLHWRHVEGIAKPFVRQIPILRRSYRAQKFGVAVVTAALDLWSARLARKQASLAPVRSQGG